MAKGIQSILLGFRLLEALTNNADPMSLKVIAAEAGMSASKARMYLISLIETELIAQNSATGLYELGPYAIRLGTRAMQRMELMSVATEAMHSLQKRTQCTVLLCAWDGRRIIIVARSEGRQPQPLQFPIGGSASLVSTATGHIFLAFGPSEQIWPALEAEIRDLTSVETERRARLKSLKQHVGQIRMSQIAEANPISYASGITLSGFAAAAAPIFDATNKLRFALTVVYRVDRKNIKAELLQLVKQAASTASRLAGGPAPAVDRLR